MKKNSTKVVVAACGTLAVVMMYIAFGLSLGSDKEKVDFAALSRTAAQTSAENERLQKQLRQVASKHDSDIAALKAQLESMRAQELSRVREFAKTETTTDTLAETVTEQTGANKATSPRAATFVTGDWSDELYQVQKQLVTQLSGSAEENSEWKARYTRASAPPPLSSDSAIARQLKERKQCNAFQNKVPWTRDDLLRDLKYFVHNVYPNRPIKYNAFGMRLSHSFGCWFIVKHLQPEIIIESGVHLGQSTWMMRNAAPNAKIYSHDPRQDMQHLDNNTEYRTGAGTLQKPGIKMMPFKDFTDMDWSFIKDKSKTLILFDDHQNSWRRFQEAKRYGFTKMIFDDNWSPLQGDNYSLKQICDESGGTAFRRPDFPSTLVLQCDNFHMSDRFIPLEEHKANREKLLSSIKVYYEAAPVLFVPAHMEFTKFGHKPAKDTSDVQYVLPRPSNSLLRVMMETTIAPPVVQSQAEFDEIGLGSIPHRELYNYANLGYVELH